MPARQPCTECGRIIRVDRQSGNYEWVTSGAVPLRLGGGANRVALLRRSGRYVCGGCVDLLDRNIHPNQNVLFPTEGDS